MVDKRLDALMTVQEARCLRAKQKWFKKSLHRKFVNGITFRNVFLIGIEKSNAALKVLRWAAAFLFFPLLLLVYLLSLPFHAVFFSARYLLANQIPRSVRGPGERNIQGIHNAFISYYKLPTDLYIDCVNEWVGILYGAAAQQRFSIEKYLELEKNKFAADFSSNILPEMASFTRNSINQARENLSKELGHYASLNRQPSVVLTR